MVTLSKVKLRKLMNVFDISYWLFWVLFILAFGYGIHRYFEYRNQELDKRLEQLQHS